MRRYPVWCLLAIALSAALAAAQAPPREELGRSVKLRILVDKVMQPENDWVSQEWMVRETAEAGFNVFSPRRGHDDLKEVEDVTGWCAKYGIYHMPWMRGTLSAPEGDEAAGRRVVWASGNEQLLWSPNSDEFWEWTNRYIVAYALMSRRMPHLIGVFLDYENYAPGKEGNLYSLSYDDVILGKFAAAQGIELPELPLNGRKAWLDEQGLHEAFEVYQIEHWRQRCRALREAVDAHNPTFQFCIYPAPGTPFMVEAAYPAWATEAAPIILADPWIYGRSSQFQPQAAALEQNRETLLRGMQVPDEADVPYLYIGGIDPVVEGADPEFSGKNALMSSDVTDGYWVFYEGPQYKVDHPAYFKWFAWANRAIEEGRLTAWQEPRETPENWGLDIFDTAADGRPLVTAPPLPADAVDLPLAKIRGEHMAFFAAEAGRPVAITLANLPLGRVESMLAWSIRDPDMNEVAKGMMDNAATETLTFTPERSGIYLLGASSGRASWAVTKANVPIALSAGGGLHTISGVERFYFHVPAGLESFTFAVRGSGAETVRLTVYDPTGAVAATDQTLPGKESVSLTVPVGEHGGRAWSLSLTKADQGVLEDVYLTIDERLSPVLALREDQVFARSGE